MRKVPKEAFNEIKWTNKQFIVDMWRNVWIYVREGIETVTKKIIIKIKKDWKIHGFPTHPNKDIWIFIPWT